MSISQDKKKKVSASKKKKRDEFNRLHPEGRKIYSLRKRVAKLYKLGHIKQAKEVEQKILRLIG